MQKLFIISVFSLSFLTMAASPRPYDVSRYRLELELDPRANPTSISVTALIEGTAMTSLPNLELDADGLKIQKVTVSKKESAFNQDQPKLLNIPLTPPLKAGQKFSVQIQYEAKIQTGHYGFFKVTDPDEPERGPLYFTHLEPQGARLFYPCNDDPSDKAITEIVAKVPAGYEALSNGQRLPDKAFKNKKEKWKVVHWKMPKPHTTYLLALAIGQFEKITDKELSFWMGKTKKAKAKFALETTRKSMDFLQTYLGVSYPWPQYQTVGIPTFVWGGMENTSSTHMNQDRVLLNDPLSAEEAKGITQLVAHELAHQWFGDSVTLKSWEDVWLNEAFASRMDTLATNAILGTQESEIEALTNTWDEYFRQEDGPRSHPIVNKNLKSPEDAFDSVNYTKGENLLRMLAFYLGENNFKKGVTLYLKQFAYGNADYQDFLSAMEKATKTDLKQFRDSWLLKRGYPIISYRGSWDGDSKRYKLTLQQTPNHPEDDTVFDIRVPVEFHRKSVPAYIETRLISLGTKEAGIGLSLPDAPEWVVVNAESQVLAKVIPENATTDTYTPQALGDPNPVNRLWAAMQLADPLLKGEEMSNKAAGVITKILEVEPSPFVRIAILDVLQRSKIKELPGPVSDLLLQQAIHTQPGETVDFSKAGWRRWKSQVLATLGKAPADKTKEILKPILASPTSPLDDLSAAAVSLARMGEDEAGDLLRKASALHAQRGYRFKYVVDRALGAFENPKAATYIRELSETATGDLLGRMGKLIQDNSVLKNSKEWKEYLRWLALESTRFDDEVKTRLLHTVEDIREKHIEELFAHLQEKSPSERIRLLAKEVLSKTFGQN